MFRLVRIRSARQSFAASRNIVSSLSTFSPLRQSAEQPEAEVEAEPFRGTRGIDDETMRVARWKRLQNAPMLADFLTDSFGREHDYLRISVTERCNLRCQYCMPEGGIALSAEATQLTTSEIALLAEVFVRRGGVRKIRLTGGEPTVRADIVPLMRRLGLLRRYGLRDLCITSNGVTLHRKLDDMRAAGMTAVNLSLDTLDPLQFQLLTRRAAWPGVQKSLKKLLEWKRDGLDLKLKINCVVMRGINDREILDFVELTREDDLEVRFIEFMPFDGNRWSEGKMVPFSEMLERIRLKFPDFQKVPDSSNDTSKAFQIPGFRGRVGFITSMTENFCGSCNRLRLTSDGNLKVCLFGNAEVSLRDVLRKFNGGKPVDEDASERLREFLPMDADGSSPGGRTIGGSLPLHNNELLDVIDAAVKRKQARHAGMGELKDMKNRPMILIEPFTALQSAATKRPQLPSPLAASRRSTWGVQWLASGMLVSISPRSLQNYGFVRYMSTKRPLGSVADDANDGKPKLTHVSNAGEAHMVPINHKSSTKRTAKATCTVVFTDSTALKLIRQDDMKKGDVLGVARVAAIMATKRTADLIPLCHPLALSHVAVDMEMSAVDATEHSIAIVVTASCEGKTGVEMEALVGASTAALTIYDMCKAVDKGIMIEGLRVILKEGGKSGHWEKV